MVWLIIKKWLLKVIDPSYKTDFEVNVHCLFGIVEHVIYEITLGELEMDIENGLWDYPEVEEIQIFHDGNLVKSLEFEVEDENL